MIFLHRWYWYEINIPDPYLKNYFQPKLSHQLQPACIPHPQWQHRLYTMQ